MTNICTIKLCSSKVLAKNLCGKHYQQQLAVTKKTNKCGCGCEQLTQYTFIAGHHTRLFTSEEQTRRGRMNTGDTQRDRGSSNWYRKIGGRHEHRIVMEQSIGRFLSSSEVVHHINGDKKDNRIENLQVMSRSEHLKEHLPSMLIAKGLKYAQKK